MPVAKEGGIFESCLKAGDGLLLLQLAIARVSYLCWEDLWNDAHPDQFCPARDGEDFEKLMPAWRKKVRTILKECHQEWVLVRDVDEYKRRLVEAGADEEALDILVGWVSFVRGD